MDKPFPPLLLLEPWALTRLFIEGHLVYCALCETIIPSWGAHTERHGGSIHIHLLLRAQNGESCHAKDCPFQ